MRLARPNSLVVLTMIAATLLVAPEQAAAAQGPAAAASAGQTAPQIPRVLVARAGAGRDDAHELRSELLDVLQKYPPSVGRVLKLDPSLMTNQAYVAPYPLLAAFLLEHPDVAHSPSFYLDPIATGVEGVQRPYTAGDRMLDRLMDGLAFVLIFGTIMFVVTWLVRTFLDYRRWTRLARVQAETHTKLMDRFTANNELIAYVESPAGSQFLQSAPIALEPGSRRLAAPVSRILWSLQAGVILGIMGVAFDYLSAHLDVDVQQAFYALGVLGMALGVGFLLSGAAAYVLSRRLGLFESLTTGSAAGPRGQASAR